VVWSALAVLIVLGVIVPLGALLVSRRLVIRHLPAAAGFGRPPARRTSGWLSATGWRRGSVTRSGKLS